MKIIRRCFMLLIMAAIFMLSGVKADAYSLVPIPKTDGGYVTYRNTQTQVLIPDQYIEQDSDFRAVWLSNFVGELPSYISEDQWKSEMNKVFTVLEYFHINAMIFHVRTHNNALYKSQLNPVAIYFQSADFSKFDPLAWTISEAHKRGIEFHAWMNPYRINPQITYPDYNIASNPEYLLNGSILDPGRPEVRDFLLETVMELVENYDVDGVHFDDYFYISGANDQATRDMYNTENLSIADFRRKQIDMFIEALSGKLHEFYQKNGRTVQLGISPSGIYQNGYYVPLENYQYGADGSLIYPLSSNTAGFAHYGNYLYSDTKKWIDNEWIDYILPQSYWGLENPAAGFADVMDWWNMAVAKKNVNLYSGMGLYMVNEKDAYSWNTNSLEAANQIRYASKLEHVQGHSIYSYKHLREAYYSTSGKIYTGMKAIHDTMWIKDAILPEIRTYNKIHLDAVTNLAVKKTSAGYKIEFDANQNAKTYAIYRSTSPLSFNSKELIEVLGNLSYDGKVSYLDKTSTGTDYYYGVIPLSKTNTLGDPASVNTGNAVSGNLLPLPGFEKIRLDSEPFYGSTVTIRWNRIYQYYGEEVSYSVSASFDGNNWFDVTTASNPVISDSYTNAQAITLDNEHRKVYVRIKAYNSVSEQTSDPYLIDVYSEDAVIKNLTYKSDSYTRSNIELKWNQVWNQNDIVYTVEMSEDGYEWTVITSQDKPAVLSGVNATFSWKLPNQPGTLFFRVTGINEKGKWVSPKLEVPVYTRIGSLDLKIDGKAYTAPITVGYDEDSGYYRTAISWKPLPLDNVYYTVRLSTDLKTWKRAKEFFFGNTLTYTTTTATQNLMFFEDYTVYVKVEASTDTGFWTSDIMVLQIPIETTPASFVGHIIDSQNDYLTMMNIFR